MAYSDNASYSVQVLTTSRQAEAAAACAKLKEYKNVRLEKISNTYKIRVGLFRSSDESLPLLKQLKKTYPGAFVKKSIIDKSQIVKAGNQDLRYDLTDAKDERPTALLQSAASQEAYQPQPSISPAIALINPSQQLPVVSQVAAIEKTPVTSEAPPKVSLPQAEDCLKAGLQYHHDRKYEEAIRSLTQFVSLAPKSQQRVSALLLIGKGLDEMNLPRSALGIYSRVIAGYPDTPEAVLSIIAMADIGFANPTLKRPPGMTGAQYMRDPVLGYDTALSKKVPAPMIEHVHYQKGRVLWKNGRHNESYEVQSRFVKEFPDSPYRRDVLTMLKTSTVTLIDQYQQSNDHLSVAGLFFRGRKDGLISNDDIDVLLKSAFSLAHLGLQDVSSGMIQSLRKITLGKRTPGIEKSLSDIEAVLAGGAGREPMADAKWETFQSGREWLRANNLPLAEQTLANLKNTGSDAFWAKVSDYALEDSRWTQKYNGGRVGSK